MKRVMWAAAILGVCAIQSAAAQFREEMGVRSVNGLGPTFDYPENMGRAPHYRALGLVAIPGTEPPSAEPVPSAASTESPGSATPAESADPKPDPRPPEERGFQFYPIEYNNYFPQTSVLHPYNPTICPDDELVQPLFPINVRVAGLEGWGLVPTLVQDFLIQDYVQQKRSSYPGDASDSAALSAWEERMQAEAPAALAARSATYWLVQNNPWPTGTTILDRSHYWCTPEGAGGRESSFSLSTAAFPSPLTRPKLAGSENSWVRDSIIVHGDNVASPNNFAYDPASFPPDQDHAFWKVVRREDTGELAIVLSWILKKTTFEELIATAIGAFPQGPAKLRNFGQYLEREGQLYRSKLEKPEDQQRLRDIFSTAQRFWKARSRENRGDAAGSAGASTAPIDA